MTSRSAGLRQAPHGTWASPVSAADAARRQVTVAEVCLSGVTAYWLQTDPKDGGRSVLMRSEGGRVSAVTGAGFDVRTDVHEYGGGAYAVSGDLIVFNNGTDGRLYSVVAGGPARPISPPPGPGTEYRFADLALHPGGREILCVRECHAVGHGPGDGIGTVRNELVRLRVDGSAEPTVIASGADFYAAPRISPDGQAVCWLSWNCPDMPWDATLLWVASLSADCRPLQERVVAGGDAEEAICQPAWSPEGTLHFISDRAGWWNLYRLVGNEVSAVASTAEECAIPAWLLGMSNYAFLPGGRIACLSGVGAMQSLHVLDPSTGAWSRPDLEYTSFDPPYLVSSGSVLAFVGAGPRTFPEVATYDVAAARLTVLARTGEADLPDGCVSRPEPLDVPTRDGSRAHALFYPPANPHFAAPPGELPPLLVMSHGGPTDQSTSALSLRLQFWTSRGFAVAMVDYRGSSGYGREYRRSLDGLWGVLDVTDCIDAARSLGDRADSNRLLIRGASAGGFTALRALMSSSTFAAGASWYGISDLARLRRETHKFEARYLDRLVGPLPAAEEVDRARSPLFALSRPHATATPVILFHGGRDEVVPPSQAEEMAAALRRRGIPHRLVVFPEEGHGFRSAASIEQALEAELAFYAEVLGLSLPDSRARSRPQP